MNPAILSSPWLHLFGVLALESAIVVGLAAALQTLLHSPVWRRTVWQTCVIALLAIAIIECFGVQSWLRETVLLKMSPTRFSAKADSNSTALPPPNSQLNSEFRNQVAERLAAIQQSDAATRLPSISNQQIPIPLAASRTSQPSSPNSKITATSTKTDNQVSFVWLGPVWVLGAGILIARGFLGRCAFALIRWRRQSTCDAELEHRVQALARGVGLARRVRVIQLRGLSSPIAFGLTQPTIALPLDFAARFNATQQSAMLVHELAHLAAHDPVWNLAADFAVAVWWWNPLAWWARRGFRAACEAAADEASLVVRGGPGALAECLVELGARLTEPRAFGWLGVGGGGFRSGLGRRVERLVNLRGRGWQSQRGARSLLAKSIGPAALVTLAVCGAAWTSPQTAGERKSAVKLFQQSWQPPFALFAKAGGAEKNSPAKSEEVSENNASKTTSTTAPTKFPPSGIDPAIAQRYGLTTAPQQEAIANPKRGRGLIAAKLERIYLEELPPLDGIPLTEVIKLLRDESERRDRDNHGINFILNSATNQAGTPAIDPTTGQPVPKQGYGMNDVRVRFTLPLRNVRLKDVLDAITKAANHPIHYTIEEYAVVFAPGARPSLTAEKNEEADTSEQIWRYAEARGWDEGMIRRYGLLLPSGPTNFVGGNPQRFKLRSKLIGIVFDETPAFDGLPLREVIRFLHDEARKHDADRRGINFVINAPSETSQSNGAIDPTTGLPLPAAPVDLNDVIIKLPALRNVRLVDVLDAVVKVAGHPLRFSVENYGVLISSAAREVAARSTPPQGSKSESSPQLFTRTFRVEPNAFIEGLENALGISLKEVSKNSQAANQVPSALTEWLAKLGVDTTSGSNTMFYYNHAGLLLVRASMKDLEIVEAALDTLNATPPQLTLTASLVTLTEEDAKALKMDWFLGHALLDGSTNGAPGTSLSKFSTNAALTTVNGVLTEPQFQVVMRALEQREGVEVVAAPRVTTLSGRQAQLSMTQRMSLFTAVDERADDKPAEGSDKEAANKKYTTTEMDFGPALDVVPYVAADGSTIHVTVICNVKEFLGYDEPPRKAGAKSVEPLPRIRISQVESHSVLMDGQTLVLGGGLISEKVLTKDKVPVLGDIPHVGRLFRSESSSTNKKHLLIFLTPTIIDPAGNSVHSAANQPFAPNTKSAKKRTVSVLGQVSKPGNYELPGEQTWTAVEAIAAAGGLAKAANDNRIDVTHNGGTTTYRFNDIRKTNEPSKNPPLEAGDVVFVAEKIF